MTVQDTADQIIIIIIIFSLSHLVAVSEHSRCES